MYVCLPACLSVCRSVCLCACMHACVCVFAWVRVCLSACVTSCVRACVSVCLTASLSACLSVGLSVSLSASLSVCLLVGLGVPGLVVEVHRALVTLLGQPHHVQGGQAQTLCLGLLAQGHIHTAVHKVTAPLHRKRHWEWGGRRASWENEFHQNDHFNSDCAFLYIPMFLHKKTRSVPIVHIL